MTNDDDLDDEPVTEADLAEARARWADPQHESALIEKFARPVYGNGIRGETALAAEPIPNSHPR